MKVALRDDDTSYFTDPTVLERVYKGIWDHVPVSLAVVPFEVGYCRKGIPEEHWRSGQAFPLGANAELVAFLREKIAERRLSVMLHGYTHQDFPDGYEFQVAHDLDRRVREGRAYLEALLGVKISVFVPPHNALSKRGLAVVSKEGLNLLGSFLSFRPSMRPWEWRTFQNWWRIQRFRRLTGRRRQDRMVYPYVLRYRSHREFGCHSLIPSTTLDELILGFEEARKWGGDFCLATHHWEIDDRLSSILAAFLNHIHQYPDVRPVPAAALFV